MTPWTPCTTLFATVFVAISTLATSGCDLRVANAALITGAPWGDKIDGDRHPSQPMGTRAAIDGLTEGMPYAALRSVVLDAGWRPKTSADCRANMFGANVESVCRADRPACRRCDDLPELETCSADGHCLMHFERGPDRLTVSTYGDIGDWHVAGPTSRLSVKWWDPEFAELSKPGR